MTNRFIERKLPFNQGAFAAAMALYSKPFYRGWTWTGPVYTGVGAARNDLVNPFYRAETLSSPLYEGRTWASPVYVGGSGCQK